MIYSDSTMKALKRAEVAMLKAIHLVQEEGASYLDGTQLTSSIHTRNYLIAKLSTKSNEEFGILYLDNQHKVINYECLFTGTKDSASVFIRPVIEKVLHAGAMAVILVHNHPSGVLQASDNDRTITKKLVEALKLIEVRVLDHIIVGGTDTFSFAEHGIL